MTTHQSSDVQQLQAGIAQAAHEHWVLFLTEGVILVVLGVLAILIPPIATIAVALVIGWLFLLSGVLGLVTTFWARHAPGFWWSLLSAVLGIVVGAAMIASPIGGALSLTFLLIAFFVIEGAATVMYAIEHRRALSGRWGWMLASGAVDLLLAAIVFAGLPGTAAWAIGLLVGINMVFGGTAMIMMALHARAAGTTAA